MSRTYHGQNALDGDLRHLITQQQYAMSATSLAQRDQNRQTHIKMNGNVSRARILQPDARDSKFAEVLNGLNGQCVVTRAAQMNDLQYVQTAGLRRSQKSKGSQGLQESQEQVLKQAANGLVNEAMRHNSNKSNGTNSRAKPFAEVTSQGGASINGVLKKSSIRSPLSLVESNQLFAGINNKDKRKSKINWKNSKIYGVSYYFSMDADDTLKLLQYAKLHEFARGRNEDDHKRNVFQFEENYIRYLMVNNQLKFVMQEGVLKCCIFKFGSLSRRVIDAPQEFNECKEEIKQQFLQQFDGEEGYVWKPLYGVVQVAQNEADYGNNINIVPRGSRSSPGLMFTRVLREKQLVSFLHDEYDLSVRVLEQHLPQGIPYFWKEFDPQLRIDTIRVYEQLEKIQESADTSSRKGPKVEQFAKMKKSMKITSDALTKRMMQVVEDAIKFSKEYPETVKTQAYIHKGYGCIYYENILYGELKNDKTGEVYKFGFALMDNENGYVITSILTSQMVMNNVGINYPNKRWLRKDEELEWWPAKMDDKYYSLMEIYELKSRSRLGDVALRDYSIDVVLNELYQVYNRLQLKQVVASKFIIPAVLKNKFNYKFNGKELGELRESRYKQEISLQAKEIEINVYPVKNNIREWHFDLSLYVKPSTNKTNRAKTAVHGIVRFGRDFPSTPPIVEICPNNPNDKLSHKNIRFENSTGQHLILSEILQYWNGTESMVDVFLEIKNLLQDFESQESTSVLTLFGDEYKWKENVYDMQEFKFKKYQSRIAINTYIHNSGQDFEYRVLSQKGFNYGCVYFEVQLVSRLNDAAGMKFGWVAVEGDEDGKETKLDDKATSPSGRPGIFGEFKSNVNTNVMFCCADFLKHRFIMCECPGGVLQTQSMDTVPLIFKQDGSPKMLKPFVALKESCIRVNVSKLTVSIPEIEDLRYFAMSLHELNLTLK